MPEKKSVGDIIIEKFIQAVDKEGIMPWQSPYNRYSAFNWFSLNQYRGINRLLLPMGEYLSMNQMIAYNKKNGTNYRFTEGTWWSVVFFKVDMKDGTRKELEELTDNGTIEEFLSKYPKGVYSGSWFYYIDTYKTFRKKRNILRYTNVADRTCFVDAERGVLPSRIENGEVEITRFKPKEIFESYVKREGIPVGSTLEDCPYYDFKSDKIVLNSSPKSEDHYWSYAFHEAAHSTGAVKRLGREFFTAYADNSKTYEKSVLDDMRSKEECIAEIAASMVCSECDIVEFNTSECDVYANNLAYVEAWKKRIKDWGNSFIYIVSEAEKAYMRIMGE